MALNGFALDAAVGTSFGFTSSNIALPGTPASDAVVIVTNFGSVPVALKLGPTNAVTVTQQTGIMLLAGQSIVLTIGTGRYLAGAANGGPGNATSVNIATGT